MKTVCPSFVSPRMSLKEEERKGSDDKKKECRTEEKDKEVKKSQGNEVRTKLP